MKIELSPTEVRILSALMEKEITTPDQYPLTLNSLTTACNQKSNREPVTNLTETEVIDGLDLLKTKHLILKISTNTGRTDKYKQRFWGSSTSVFDFKKAEAALLSVLMLRGAQTPGELRTRTARFHEFSSTTEVESVLEKLATRDDGPYVRRLEREPGKREARYIHLFMDDEDTSSLVAMASSGDKSGTGGSGVATRVEVLEGQVAELTAELNALKQLVDELLA